VNAKNILKADFNDARVKVNMTDFVLFFEGFEHLDKQVDLLAESMLAE
jgi:hypothetical protein